jgi:hypothetical protein
LTCQRPSRCSIHMLESPRLLQTAYPPLISAVRSYGPLIAAALGPVAPEMKTTAPALMLRGIEEYGRGSLFVSRSMGWGQGCEKPLREGMGWAPRKEVCECSGRVASCGGAGCRQRRGCMPRETRRRICQWALAHLARGLPHEERSCWLALWGKARGCAGGAQRSVQLRRCVTVQPRRATAARGC